MKTWLLSVAATVILTILLELLLTEGTVKKYIQGILRILLLFVIISPVVKFVNGKINLNIDSDILPDSSYNYLLDTINKKRYDHIEKKIQDDIYTITSFKASVNISEETIDNFYSINMISIDVDLDGINRDEDNILLREKIIAIVKKYLDISEDKIIINGIAQG